MVDYKEIGDRGIKQWMGYIEAAYSADLRWPGVQPLYSRLRRSDPEISAVRQVFAALARGCSIDWQLPDEPNDADKEAQAFAQSVTDDIAGGPGAFLETMVSQVPFMGWGWWEVVPGVRDPNWTPPNDDDWRSEFTDGRVGIRRLAWRDSSSFYAWDLADNGRLRGMVQQNFPKPAVTLPIERSLHLTFGDNDNPEGLSPLEAVWRLERIKYGLEVVQGIGFEHTAGILKFSAENGLTPADKAEVKQAARSAMSAQEGNYLALPKGVLAEFLDVPFTAAPAILEAIRYYGLLKLQVFLTQWIAIASTAGTGAYSAMSDASSMFITTFNAMLDGFANQMDAQIGKRLFTWNNFPGMTKRPKLIITGIDKTIALGELGSIITALKGVMPLGDEDFIAIRKKTAFLPETLPEVDETPQPEPEPEEEPEPENEGEENEPEPTADDNEGENADNETSEQARQMAQREYRWQRYLIEHPEALNRE